MSMSLSRPFILRPIATSLIMLAILLSGIFAFQLLPVSSLPEVDYPTIQVVTFYPGGSPDVMNTSVTAPLERQFGQMPGLNQMTSTSSSGSSIITLQFTLDLGLDVAEQEVQAAINAATTFLPTGLPFPPIYNKVNPADAPILTLALTTHTLPMTQVEDFADTRLSEKISQISGVGLVSISGGQRPAVRIQVNPNTLTAYGLSLETVRNAVLTANLNAAKGSFDGPHLAYTIYSNDQLLSSADYKPLIVAYRNNAPVRLSDVANVIDGAENIRQAAWMNTEPAVIMNIQRQPGANVIAVTDRVKNLLKQLKTLIPGDISVHVLTDRTLTIRASVKDVEYELMLSIALVVMVMFIFLRNIPATLIPSISVPLSLVGTFGIMYLLGFSLNNLTLMALTIATGFVVDDAIVMIENISRYIDDGHTPLEAALKGSKQIGFTILSLTVSLIAVLIPLLFMGDVIGLLFRQFALTVAVTILISAFVSLTLTPMLCSRFLRHHEPEEESQFQLKAEEIQKKVITRYGDSLRWVLDNQPFILLVALITLIITGILIVFIPKGFFPVQDTGVIQGITVASQPISFAQMEINQQKLARVVLADPAVESLSSFIGIDGTNVTQNSGRLLINLKPLGDRSGSAIDIIRRLQTQVSKIAGIQLYMQPIQDLSVDDRVTRTQFQFSVSSPNADEVSKWTAVLVNKFKEISVLRDVTSDQQNLGLQTSINIDRDTAYRLGVTASTIDNLLYDAFGQRQISTIFTQRNQYHVVMEAMPLLQLNPGALQNIYSNDVNGNPIPLSAFTTVTQTLGPLVINRQNQFPVATISFNLPRHGALGDSISAINAKMKDIALPDSVQAQFEGSAKIFESSLHNEGLLVLAAIIVVYIVLGVLYESYIHPITILSTLPSACMGALLALILFRESLTVIALIGIILLIGIVMKNAIMMIDFALEQERRYNKSPRDAIYEACILRFRPILMTTMASMLGAVPLALGIGMGAELRQPLGIVIISGLIVSQLLTLYTTPVIYLGFDRVSRSTVAWYKRNFGSSRESDDLQGDER
jgi:multidrug efflux pump